MERHGDQSERWDCQCFRFHESPSRPPRLLHSSISVFSESNLVAAEAAHAAFGPEEPTGATPGATRIEAEGRHRRSAAKSVRANCQADGPRSGLSD